MHYLKPDPSQLNVNVQLRWISLFSKSSWIKTTASALSYELGVNGKNWGIINKNGHSTFHTGKPRFTSVKCAIVPTRIVLLNRIVHLNTANCIVRN